MKKISTILILFIVSVTCFAQSIEWKVIRQSELYDGNFRYVKNIQANTIVNPRKTSIYPKEETESVLYAYGAGIIFQNTNYIIDAEAVIPNGTKDLLPENLLTPALNRQGKNWYNVNCVSVLKSKNRNTAYEYSYNALTRYEEKRSDFDSPWWKNLVFDTNIFQVILNLDALFNEMRFYVLNIEKKSKRYELQAKCNSWWMFDSKIPKELQPEEGSIVSLTLYDDGDYLDIFFEDKYFIGSYAAMDNEFKTQFETLLETNTCDLTNVTFPRRADKNHTVGASCIVAENLRLRKEESTSSAALQTMQTGTSVKILQLGKKQTIDGITANWVQAELSDGTRGWCFGGYLVEK